jgi:hypothetical protein
MGTNLLDNEGVYNGNVRIYVNGVEIAEVRSITVTGWTAGEAKRFITGSSTFDKIKIKEVEQ